MCVCVCQYIRALQIRADDLNANKAPNNNGSDTVNAQLLFITNVRLSARCGEKKTVVWGIAAEIC